MNHQILQDSIVLKKEVKILLGEISKGKEGGSAMGHSSKQPNRKRSRHEDSREIEQVKMKQPAKCWKCEDIIYNGTAQRGIIKRATTTKFLDLGMS